MKAWRSAQRNPVTLFAPPGNERGHYAGNGRGHLHISHFLDDDAGYLAWLAQYPAAHGDEWTHVYQKVCA